MDDFDRPKSSERWMCRFNIDSYGHRQRDNRGDGNWWVEVLGLGSVPVKFVNSCSVV